MCVCVCVSVLDPMNINYLVESKPFGGSSSNNKEKVAAVLPLDLSSSSFFMDWTVWCYFRSGILFIVGNLTVKEKPSVHHR